MPDDRDSDIQEAAKEIVKLLIPVLRAEIRQLNRIHTLYDLNKLIFINYRHNDSEDVCGRIYDRLAQELGSDNIFRDVVSMLPGHDFRLELERQVAACNIMLVLMGREWLNRENRNRLHDENDYVRFEIETALRRDIPVIPVFVARRDSMPSRDELPESLRDLVYRQAVFIRPDPDFHTDMERLVDKIKFIAELLD